jgi:hypothetical protein
MEMAVTRLMPVCPRCTTTFVRPNATEPILQPVAVTCVICAWTGHARFWEPQQDVTDAAV